MKTVFSLVLMLLLFGCSEQQQGFIFPEGDRIFTRDDARIYFQNVRSPYYEMEENAAAGIKHYRLKNQDQDSLVPNIKLIMSDAWQRNEIYLIPEPNAWFQSDTFTISCNCEGEISSIPYRTMPPAQASKWVYELYQKRNRGCKLRVNDTPLFNAEQEKVFRKVVRDYIKWIE